MKKIDIKPDVLDVLKSTLFATLISLALVLVFAIVLKFTSLPSAVIMPVNIVIKLLSLFVGILLGFKNKQNGILKGAITGLVFMLLTFFIFAALNAFKDVKFSWIDLITLPIAGALSGIAAVNIRPRKQA
ncbi:MAG: TIGR04086 family membrane protein [Clostridia bacterium]|nr:TIGR04086 family membrane protein [Clostridia bacterium]